MDIIPLNILRAEIFSPYGAQLKQRFPWYPQALCTDWPHHASALTLGESNVVKYGVSYPLRTGLDEAEEADFVEATTYLSVDDEESGQAEELFLSRGVCVISRGPLGGPSYLKGIYRPLVSYGTGLGIRCVTKTSFPQSTNTLGGTTDDHTFTCLAERGGISMYSEITSETHVSHVPEFHIDRILPCTFGLLVIPSKVKSDPDTDYHKGLYVLTHPVKQVSKIWIINRTSHEYCEYDNREENLLWCEKDLCVFWSLKNDKILIRRLVHLDKNEMLQLSTLNASMYITNPETPSRFFSQGAPSSTMFSPFTRHPHTRSSAMRVNREGASLTYWPSFDFSNTSNGSNNIGHGFYPPHICIYDDPEVYFKPLFQIDLAKGHWKEPRKFQLLLADDSNPNRVALWFLIKNNLYLHGFDVESGTKLSHYALGQVSDFTCPTGKDKLPLIIMLECNGNIRLGWLDINYKMFGSSIIDITSVYPDSTVLSVDNMLFGDTILCTLRTNSKDEDGGGDIPGTERTVCESVSIHLRNYKKNGLIRKCIEALKIELPSKIATEIVARYVGLGEIRSVSSEWTDFSTIMHTLCSVQPEKEQFDLRIAVVQALHTLNENLKITCFSMNYTEKLNELLREMMNVLLHTFDEEKQKQIPFAKTPSHLASFGYLLGQENPSTNPAFDKLPEVLQRILDDPDTVENVENFIKIRSENEHFAPVIELLIADIFHRNSLKAQFDFPEAVLQATGRTDYLSGYTKVLNKNLMDNKNGLEEAEDIFVKKDDLIDEPSWTTPILNLNIFSEDRRVEEVCRILDSSTACLIESEQRAEMSDHDFVEEQEKNLMQLVQINLAATAGRAAFTLRTEEKSYANLTSIIFIPEINFSGKCAIKGTNIDLNETDLPAAYVNWPTFHNAVAAALSVRFTDAPADAWFAYNKAKIGEGPDQAGMILGFGLNGILASMPPTLRHEHLSKESSFTTMAMLLGLSANLAGTGDMSTSKLNSLHIGAMLPACTTELEIPRLATLVAPCSLGLLFLGTHNSHIAKVLLGEISKRFTPLSVFGSGGGGGNSSASLLNPAEVSGGTNDREAHSLCAGFGLGFVNLGKGRLKHGGYAEDDFNGVLRRFVVGGPKPTDFHGNDEDELYSQFGQTLPSLWEEYRCCHIEEGDNVNVDVTTPSAIIAVSLIYLRSGNEAVLNWLSPPTTLHLLDGVRPDLLMLRALASILVFQAVPTPSVSWLEGCLMPKSLIESALQQPDKQSRLDHESINQAWACIVCGYCLGLGIRFAGTSDVNVTSTLWHYTNTMLQLSSKESKLSEYFPKNFLESCVCNLLMSLSLVLAGTGDIAVLRLCRYLQAKVSANPCTISSNTYGLEMCISMATGIVFLGGGRYSLSNDDKSIAVLLPSVFPKWPVNSNDNRYHLQALRHLYILAAQPRLILPKPMPFRSKLHFDIEFIDGHLTQAAAPVLLPPFYLIKKIKLDHPDFLPVEFNLPNDLKYLEHIVQNSGILNLVPKPIGTSKYSFLRQMTWRNDHVFHPTFEIDRLTPKDEIREIKEINKISSLEDWSGMKEVVYPVLALTTGNPANEDWQWQVKILHWWVERSKAKGLPTCFPDDLLSLLRKKAAGMEGEDTNKIPAEMETK